MHRPKTRALGRQRRADCVEFRARLPSLSRQLCEGSDDRARHHQLDIVVRMIRFLAEEIEPATGIDTVPRPDPMLALVPAAERDVDAAAKGDLIIDDDNFLVMAGAEGDC